MRAAAEPLVGPPPQAIAKGSPPPQGMADRSAHDERRRRAAARVMSVADDERR